MITAEVFTEEYGDKRIARRMFDDITDAEQYAMKILGFESLHGVVTLVRVNDTMTGESSEFEY